MSIDVFATCEECGHVYNASRDDGTGHADDCPIREHRASAEVSP